MLALWYFPKWHVIRYLDKGKIAVEISDMSPEFRKS
jgi:hypothetical protein